MILLAIDPGKKTGLATFAHGILIEAMTVDGDAWKKPPTKPPGLVVCERPELRYQGTGRKAPAGDLITLAIRAGQAVACYGGGAPVEWTTPARWKGSVPKDVHHDRIRRALGPGEGEIFDRVGPDARDAIGLGAWYLTRL